ncbi:hypothetical protein SH661x_001147 [Planctomicrobium sp. SH661]|uniref:hypothetical protein n=1 Tax=Planctomicrobium sp. SH661 TaxID=3448124 RepID=UPI003F5C728F
MRGWIFVAFVLCGLMISSSSPAWAQKSGPQLYTSKNFQVMTDIPQAEAKDLLDRLETMLKLVAAYFGSPLRKPIRMYVVKDFANWPQSELQKMEPDGIASIRQQGGLTITTTRGIRNGPKLDADAIVYATADHGTPQHEAIHAYCGITFGETGPTWYSEGMAEVGQYWKANDKGVNAKQGVIDYLKSREPKPLAEIINNPLETTGDSWQNYAWRWAICHMLGFNENYTARFKPLGMGFLTGANVSFDSVYGGQLQEIDFEYRLFLKDLEPGYRCDLCSWDWKTPFKAVKAKPGSMAKINAKEGWQASRGLVESGVTYQVSTTGTWKLSKDGEELTAAGEADGKGQLMGIIFKDYTLSEPFPIGDSRTFTAPADGKLFLRCGDNWGELGDNQGTITVRVTATE